MKNNILFIKTNIHRSCFFKIDRHRPYFKNVGAGQYNSVIFLGFCVMQILHSTKQIYIEAVFSKSIDIGHEACAYAYMPQKIKIWRFVKYLKLTTK